MRVNEAAAHLAVFWACVWLSSENEEHTVKNIRNRLGEDFEPSKRLNEDTISTKLDYLERFSAVVFDYPKEKRQGRHPVARLLNPYKIPLEVRRAKPSRTRLFEWGKELDKPHELLNGQAFTVWKDGIRVLNSGALNEKMKTPLRNIVKWATPIGHFIFDTQTPQELDFNWILSEINGQPFNLDNKGLKRFYRYILLQFMFTYPHDWENAPYLAQMRRTEKMFRRSVSFVRPDLYAEFALDRKKIVLHRIVTKSYGVFRGKRLF